MNKVLKCSAGIVSGCAGFLLCSAAAYMPFVISDAHKGYDDECDYLMILGGNIVGAETPSPQLLERMIAAADYLSKHDSVVAVPCGGCFRKNQKKSEAQVICDYLVENGVDKSRIYLEDKSTTTFENFEYALKIIENLSGKSADELNIAFLSSSYHMHRAGLIAHKCGIKNVLRVSCITPGKAFPRYIREYFVAYEFPKRKVEEFIYGSGKKK